MQLTYCIHTVIYYTIFCAFVKNEVSKIKKNFKKSYIFFAVLDVLLVLVMLALLILSLIFGGELAPKVFSHRVYLLDTDAFSLVEKGSAVIADQVPFNEIVPGNIILYTDDANKTRVGEIQLAQSENNVYTYTVKNDAETEVTVGQSHILGKGIYYSKFIGSLVSFVTSPTGVCCLAVLPCVAFLIFEVMGMIKRRTASSAVEPVKKQDEIPTYIPEGLGAKRRVAEAKPDDESFAFSDGRQSLMEAAGLFSSSSQKKPEPRKEPPKERKPVLEKDIDKLIKEAKAKRINEEASSPKREEKPVGTKGAFAARNAYEQIKMQTSLGEASERVSAFDNDPVSAVNDMPVFSEPTERNELPRRVEPPKRPSSRVSPRVSRLDTLLKNDNSGSQYDINDILRNIDGK